MNGGSLFERLHTSGTGNVGWRRKLEWGRDIARGLMYLHARGIVHRDIKSGNCLMGSVKEGKGGERVVISDLDLSIDLNTLKGDRNEMGGKDGGGGGDIEGLLKEKDMKRGPSNGRLKYMVGTVVYMSPEVLRGYFGGIPGDVYAYGILLNEILCQAVPFVDRRLPVPELHTVLESRFNMDQLRKAIVEGLRPSLVEGVPRCVKEVIEKCWREKGGERPGMTKVVEVLDQVLLMSDEELEKAGVAEGKGGKGSGKGESLEHDGMRVDGQEVEKELEQLDGLAQNIPTPNESALVALEMTSSQSDYVPALTAGLSSTSGKRGEDRMEDCSTIIPKMHGAALLAVYDGHGGAECAEFTSRYLPLTLYHSLSLPESLFRKSLQQAFLNTNRLFLNYPEYMENESGCTALVSMIVKNRLYVANAGDCRAVLGKADGTAVQLTNDHTINNPNEQQLLQQRGAKIINNRVQGHMMVTRAIGDHSVAQYITAEPEITEIELTQNDEFLIMASDGLWDVVSTEMATTLVRATVRVPEMAAKRLALKAIELGSEDNISVVVAFLTPVSNMMIVER